MILDSSFLIDLMDEDAGAVAKMEALDRDQLTVPTIVYTELGTGLDAGIKQRLGEVGPHESRAAGHQCPPSGEVHTDGCRRCIKCVPLHSNQTKAY